MKDDSSIGKRLVPVLLLVVIGVGAVYVYTRNDDVPVDQETQEKVDTLQAILEDQEAERARTVQDVPETPDSSSGPVDMRGG